MNEDSKPGEKLSDGFLNSAEEAGTDDESDMAEIPASRYAMQGPLEIERSYRPDSLDRVHGFAVERNGTRYIALLENEDDDIAWFLKVPPDGDLAPGTSHDVAVMMFVLEHDLTAEQKETFAPQLTRLRAAAFELGAQGCAYCPELNLSV